MKEHELKMVTNKADELAREYNRTKDPKIKEEWYKLIRSQLILQDYNKTL